MVEIEQSPLDRVQIQGIQGKITAFGILLDGAVHRRSALCSLLARPECGDFQDFVPEREVDQFEPLSYDPCIPKQFLDLSG
ncbi:hypothetical protein SDC9_186952 [bioreactor metagenome]|uniref:Uncharacterized protein n=1 Tax=bioreactor metagenome TaxID=1076179 RepID=A0A645HTE2_9ZZZZ